MKTIKRISLAIMILSVLLGAAYALIPNSKYHVKKFVKENELLYGAAKNVLELKYSIFAKLRGNSNAKRNHFRPDVTKKNWQIFFDASKRVEKIRRFWGSIGFESFKGGLLTSEGRELLELMRDTNDRVGAHDFSQQAFRYIRGHNLYSNGEPPWGEGCDIYQVDEKGNVSYNWEIADRVFDSILKNGFKPIVEFGFMPDALASIPDRRQKWGRGNISPPKDHNKWSNLVYETVKHLCERYGEEEVKSWYFEVWNEPDLGWLFWIEDDDPRRKPYGDLDAYHKLYDYTLTAAKTAFPGIRVGGPASAGGGLDLLLEHVLLEDKFVNGRAPVAVDFLSTHAYGRLDANWRSRKSKGPLRSIKWKIDRAAKHDHEKVRNKMRETPFLLTEVGPKGESHFLNNTRFAAAWLVKLVQGIYSLADKEGKMYLPWEIVYWGSNQAIRYYEIRKGVAASLKYRGSPSVFKRPIFNAFEALAHFSGERIEMTSYSRFGNHVNGIASVDGDKLTVLVYHLNERDRRNTSNDSMNVELIVEQLPFQKYRVSWFTIDETHSNSFTIWRRMGKPKRLSKRQHEVLSQRDDLELQTEPWIESSAQRKFHKNFGMQNNSVSLFLLNKIN
ncbi:hypothetical protein GWO43_21695 [candidate division KSB1 bacterium]|nr:hypothetical protein [candidate division KSB1 bacterium]NIR72207.1 hypothetical protein [candidate division KSB1 bacterium]NIS26672.1 hypothetical protein [candidate division KSB1 bacterium]NIT73440.1 hypothetical protein [candidate division KSB1 bacterium]NIU27288.1 hypothetical protein [candidate division KSB1 bacterium]